MRERPILYSAPMVLALLAGRKSQTRRIIKSQPQFPVVGGWRPEDYAGNPYAEAGDRLWGREAWKTDVTHDHRAPRDVPRDAALKYLADGRFNDTKGIRLFGRYRHARFMMRWMSRLLHEVTAVRVERLQDITEADAIAEGLESFGWWAPQCPGWRWPGSNTIFGSARDAYLAGWDTINGKGSAASNPWVWAVSFRPVTFSPAA